ncbi:MAG: OmpA family protein [Verrucomicrobiales bacterium]|nr:OmpA family protein [Verrucomicrobiales bacterium]
MRFLFAAFLFLVSVAGFSFLAKTLYQGAIEAEFEEMAKTSFEEAGLNGVVARFNHHDVSLTGYVDSEEARAKILAVLQEAVPLARISEGEAESLPIRPTLPPSLRVSRAPASQEVLVEGVMGSDGEANRDLLVRRLRALDGVEKVSDQIALDPRQLPLEKSAELATLAAEVLRESDEARIQFGEAGLQVSGQVSNTGRRDSILDLAARVEPEKLEVSLELLEPELPPSPSEFSLTRNRFGIVVSGRVPSLDSKENLVRILEDSGTNVRVTDRIEIDQTLVPATWEGDAESLIAVLLTVFQGEMTAEFQPEQIRLTGTAETEESYQELLSALKKLKTETSAPEILADVTVLEDQVKPAPEAARAPELLITFQPNLMILTGFLPDISFLKRLEENLESRKEGYAIQNELTEAPSTASAGWLPQLGEFLEEAALRTESGVFRFSEEGLAMEGMTREIADKQILQNVAVNSVPSGFSIENQLSHEDEAFPEPELLPEDRDKLSEELKKYPIYFAKNSDLISTEEREKLKEVVTLLEEAGFPVELKVTGFADNIGNAEYNRQLSLRRAKSVVEALDSAGVSKERITEESKGEDVTSVSRSDRWKSRRVEISLVPITEEEAP